MERWFWQLVISILHWLPCHGSAQSNQQSSPLISTRTLKDCPGLSSPPPSGFRGGWPASLITPCTLQLLNGVHSMPSTLQGTRNTRGPVPSLEDRAVWQERERPRNKNAAWKGCCKREEEAALHRRKRGCAAWTSGKTSQRRWFLSYIYPGYSPRDFHLKHKIPNIFQSSFALWNAFKKV